MKQIKITTCTLLLLLLFTSLGYGQVRSRMAEKVKNEPKKNVSSVNFFDRTTVDIKVGNIIFSNFLALSGKVNTGYKFTDWLHGGVGGKVFYTQFVVSGQPDPSYTDYGGFLYGRAKLFRSFFIQGEYAFMTYENLNVGPSRINVNHPLVGVGYFSGNDTWRFGAELMFIISETARDQQGSLAEYWIGAIYNF